MITVYLDNELSRFAHETDTLTISGETPAQVLLAVFNLYPSLYAHILLQDKQKVFTVVYNDEALLEQEDLKVLPLQDGDTLHLTMLLPHGEYSAVFNIVSTVISTAWVAHAVSAIIVIGLAVALQVVMGMLQGDLAMPDVQSGSIDNSHTYTFEGIRNTTATGTPISLVYGTHRTGGHILSLYTIAEDTDTEAAKDATSVRTDTMLFYQIGLSEGEIAAVSDIEINKLPAYFYSAVYTAPDTNYYRLGQATQAPMPEFDRTFSTTSIGRKISVANPPISAVPVNYTSATPVYGVVEVELNIHGDYARTTIKRGFYSPSYGITQY